VVAQELISQGINLPLPLAVLLVGGIVSPLVGLLAERVGLRRLREAWMIVVSGAALVSVYILYRELLTPAGDVAVRVVAIWGQLPPLGGCFEIDALSVS